ncbi:MAG: hypothetical protein V3V33_07595 [Candidatus Lokiarchaeia archaeon]
MIIENDLIRITVEENHRYTTEKIEIKDNDNWIPIIGSNDECSTLNIWKENKRETKPLSFLKSKKKKLYYQLNDDDFLLNLDYCLEETNIIHIRYKLSNNRDINLSKLGVNYAILLENEPDFTWVPHLRPRKNLVIGDHVYRSPVIVYKKGKYALAFIPDLKTLRNNHPYQSFIDLNLKAQDFKERKQISYCFGNYQPTGHIFFKHIPSKEWKIVSHTDLTFRYYIIVFKEKSEIEILQYLNDFFWEKYGKKLLYENLEPQILPYDINVNEGFNAIIERHKYWCDFKIDQENCGGFWQRSWLGKDKQPIKFVKPDEVYKITHYYSNIQRLAQIWNNAWFLNIRSAYGFRYFGEFWKNSNLIDKGNKMFNTILNLSRINGVFPSVIFPESLTTNNISTVNGLKAIIYIEEFHVVDSCLSMYWALKYYQTFGDKKEKTLDKCYELVDLLEKIQLENGAIPTYLSFKNNEEAPTISKDLINSASSGAPLMFLLEFYKITKEEKVIQVCKKIANYIQTEIISEDKWHDFEPFYSCKGRSLNFFDEYTNCNLMSTLSMYWCAEGFKELYKITGNVEYLTAGERTLAVLSLFQQIWNMPYISINTFGGFGVQNVDAELNDARQALFVCTYMEYYLITGKREYIERGIAALRASWALQLLKEYEKICPGNLKAIETIDGIDKGCVCENYGHLGKDERVSGYIMFDWGIGSAATATAYVKKVFGDLFIDFKERLTFGIDGVLIKSFEFQEEEVHIELNLIQGKDYILIKCRDSPLQGSQIIVNNFNIGKKEKIELDNGFKYEIII